MRHIAWLPVIAVALAGCTTFWTGDIEPAPAPEVRAIDVDGNPVNVTVESGPVLLDFMGTWCAPCQRAVPVLRELQAAYPNLTIISVSSTDTAEQVQDFRAQHQAPWPHIVDPGGDRIVEPYREAGSAAPNMMWPSYALVIEGQIVFYNRGETLPTTFASALDRHLERQAPAVSREVAGPVVVSLVLGAAAWFSPWLVPSIQNPGPSRPPAHALLPLLFFAALGLMVAYASRPLTGRVATVAPFLAAGGLVAVVWWRWRGARPPQGKWMESEGWKHAWGIHGNALWYTIPVWGAVLHAGLLRTAPLEALLMVSAFGVGLAMAAWQARPLVQRLGENAAWIGAGALLVGAAWNGLLYIR